VIEGRKTLCGCKWCEFGSLVRWWGENSPKGALICMDGELCFLLREEEDQCSTYFNRLNTKYQAITTFINNLDGLEAIFYKLLMFSNLKICMVLGSKLSMIEM
jgi:hypothetical protein